VLRYPCHCEEHGGEAIPIEIASPVAETDYITAERLPASGGLDRD
jgi:hypothetical protein